MDVAAETCDLDRYLAKIIDEADRPLFEEACRAAAAGALRAAYVIVWLCCAESLKRRFGQLAARDHTAGKVLSRVAEREGRQQSVDGYLLEQAAKYGMLTPSEQSRLQHAYDMRCVFSHPYEEAPTCEELTAAASTVIDVVLSRPVKLRHGYLQEQVRLLTEEAVLLDDLSEAVSAYAADVFPRVDDALHLWFLQRLWASAEDFAGDPSMAIFTRRVRWFSVSYILQDPGLVLAAWEPADSLLKTPKTANWIFASPRLFPLVGRGGQDIIVGQLLDRATALPKLVTYLTRLQRAGALSDRQVERLQAHLSGMSLHHLAASQVPLGEWVQRVVDQLASRNWGPQNEAASALIAVGPEQVSVLELAVQEELGRNALQAAEGGSWSAVDLVMRNGPHGRDWPEAFVRGVVLECFINEDGETRFKGRHVQHALAMLASLPKPAAKRVAKALRESMAAGSPKYRGRADDDRDDMLAAIDAAIADTPDLAKLLPQVRDQIAVQEAPEDD